MDRHSLQHCLHEEWKLTGPRLVSGPWLVTELVFREHVPVNHGTRL